ncbi:MAG: hypothetical protein R2702_14620 [Acidimicrobiales bacterium]
MPRGAWSDLISRPAAGLAAAAVAGLTACIGFRTGALSGGWVGVDLLLAVVGWLLASDGATSVALRRRVAAGLAVTWRPVAVALGLAVAYVLVDEAAATDGLLRGEALALVGGYGNWHLLALGPVEAPAVRGSLPLQHLWAVAVAVQGVAIWALVVAATRGRARRRAERRDPAIGLALVLAGAAWLVGLGAAVAGVSDQAVLVATPSRVVALLASAALALTAHEGRGARAWSFVHATRGPALAVLAVLAVVGDPASAVGRWSSASVVPLLAVVAVAGLAPWPEAARPTPALAAPATPGAGVALGVAAWLLVPPSLALVGAILPDEADLLVIAVGLLLAVPLAAGCALGAIVAPADGPAAERRRVLVPPAIVALLVLLFSVTGAFHWEAPQTRRQWESTRGGS